MARELFVQAVAPTGLSVGQSRLQGVVRVKALKEQIPEGDQGVKEPVVEALGFERGQLAQGLVRQELDEEDEQLGGTEGGRGRGGFGFKGVFLEDI